MRPSRPPRNSATADSGSALVITLMVMALVAALATTVATLSIRNLQSARLSQEGGVAVNAADAGVAQAVSYLRANGLHDLCPAPTVHNPRTAVFNNGFDLATQKCVTSFSAAEQVPGQPYRVVIVTRAAFPTKGVGGYTVYSKGVGAEQAARPAARLVAADLAVTGGGTPKGSSYFGHAILGSGNVNVYQSIFTTGCVYNRTKITMHSTDANGLPIRDAYGLPPAIHSAQIITDDNGTAINCSRTSKAIHDTDVCAPSQPFDQDLLGGSLAAKPLCSARPPRPPDVSDATWLQYYPEGSKISSPQMLLSLFDIKDPALDQTEIDKLRAIATSQGNIYCSPAKPGCPASPSEVTPNGTQAVLFYDLATPGDVDLRSIRGFDYAPGCPSRSLVIVVVGGGTTFPSGGPLLASVFVTTPGMLYSTNGGKLVGSVYADKISLGGNAQLTQAQQSCADSNPSPTLLDFNVTAYREIDG